MPAYRPRMERLRRLPGDEADPLPAERDGGVIVTLGIVMICLGVVVAVLRVLTTAPLDER